MNAVCEACWKGVREDSVKFKRKLLRQVALLIQAELIFLIAKKLID